MSSNNLVVIKVGAVGICLTLAILVSGTASAKALSACGVSIPEVPGFSLEIRAENNICYGEFASKIKLNPDILIEENVFIIEPVPFETRLKDTARFDGKGNYIYSYAVDDVIRQTDEEGKVSLEQLTASGTASLRVVMSPFILWSSEEDISAASEKFSIASSGLRFDCFYGLAGVGKSTVTLSVCVPRSTDIADPKLSDIKAAFQAIKLDVAND
ncbi:hypothetical protein [Pseudomonas sp. PMCC200344]|uniref:hypothetical protein n=1 Tax=Pseudomonas sp. PMCC200344 TaxID=3042028 RepID=UPI0024B39023|nr:hypothetical protein [Pseudomonas sp. PMCC200344]